jgi:hypothetical protein
VRFRVFLLQLTPIQIIQEHFFSQPVLFVCENLFVITAHKVLYRPRRRSLPHQLRPSQIQNRSRAWRSGHWQKQRGLCVYELCCSPLHVSWRLLLGVVQGRSK